MTTPLRSDSGRTPSLDEVRNIHRKALETRVQQAALQPSQVDKSRINQYFAYYNRVLGHTDSLKSGALPGMQT